MARSPEVASEMQALFLLRLRQVLDKRHGPGSAAWTDDQRLQLDRAIYSTFCDCLELDLGDQARALLKDAHLSR